MTDPFHAAKLGMDAAGFSIDKIPMDLHEEHLWADGLLLFWHKFGRLPTTMEMAEEMFDEWDDPVSTQEAEDILKLLTQ